MQVCDNIRKIREKKNLSQYDMAKLLDVKRSTYAGWEKANEPQASMFYKISQVLEVSMYDLLQTDGKSASLRKSDQSDQNDLLKIHSEQKALRIRIERIEQYLKIDSGDEKDTPENVQVKDKIRKDISAGKGKKSK